MDLSLGLPFIEKRQSAQEVGPTATSEVSRSVFSGEISADSLTFSIGPQSSVKSRTLDMAESGTQTASGWSCPSCVRPPKLPSTKAASRDINKGNTKQKTESSSSGNSQDLHHAVDCAPGQVLAFQVTPSKSQVFTIRMALAAWNCRRGGPGTCCAWHVSIKDLRAISKQMQATPCKLSWKPHSLLQCGECFLMSDQEAENDDGLNYETDVECQWCGGCLVSTFDLEVQKLLASECKPPTPPLVLGAGTSQPSSSSTSDSPVANI